MRDNGSPYPKFDMDDNRTYLTVTLPVHPYFLPQVENSTKELAYRERIFAALKGKKLSVNELSRAMGYKGITAKLSSTVEKMLETGALEKVMAGAYVKLHIPGDV